MVEWQVVEYQDSMVQTGDLSFGIGNLSVTATLSQTVNRNKSWLIYNYKTDDGSQTDVSTKLVRGLITDNDTLTFNRVNSGHTLDLTWYLVEFIDDTRVQHASESH